MLQWLKKKHATPESQYYDQKTSSSKIQEITRETVLSTALPGMAVNKSVESYTRNHSWEHSKQNIEHNITKKDKQTPIPRSYKS